MAVDAGSRRDGRAGPRRCVVGGALLVGCVVFARRGDDQRSFTCAVAATLALSPIVWLHYLVVAARSARDRATAVLAALAAAGAAVGQPAARLRRGRPDLRARDRRGRSFSSRCSASVGATGRSPRSRDASVRSATRSARWASCSRRLCSSPAPRCWSSRPRRDRVQGLRLGCALRLSRRVRGRARRAIALPERRRGVSPGRQGRTCTRRSSRSRTAPLTALPVDVARHRGPRVARRDPRRARRRRRARLAGATPPCSSGRPAWNAIETANVSAASCAARRAGLALSGDALAARGALGARRLVEALPLAAARVGAACSAVCGRAARRCPRGGDHPRVVGCRFGSQASPTIHVSSRSWRTCRPRRASRSSAVPTRSAWARHSDERRRCSSAALSFSVRSASRRERDERRSFTCAIAAAHRPDARLWQHYLVLLVVPVALARPRFSAIWLLPILLWVVPRVPDSGLPAVGPLLVCARHGRPAPRRAAPPGARGETDVTRRRTSTRVSSGPCAPGHLSGARALRVDRVLWRAAALLVLISVFAAAVGDDSVAFDFRRVPAAAHAILHGESPYRPRLRPTSVIGRSYVYPPLTALVAVPFTALSEQAAGLS